MKKIRSPYTLFAAGVLFLICTLQASAQTILIDIGSPVAGRTTDLPGWNNITSDDWDGSGLLSNYALVDSDDKALTTTFSITSPFSGINAAGADNAISPFEATAVKDNWFFRDPELNPVIEIGGLSPSSTYTFDILASRDGISDTRSADLTVTGAGSSMQQLDASNNTSTYVTFADVTPDSNGMVSLSFVLTSGSSFAYLNGIQITGPFTAAVPEPGAIAVLMGVFALGGMIFRRRLS